MFLSIIYLAVSIITAYTLIENDNNILGSIFVGIFWLPIILAFIAVNVVKP